VERPLGTFIVSELFVSAWTWHFAGLKFNIAHRGNFLNIMIRDLSGKERSESFRMLLIGLNKTFKIVSVRWWGDV